ncbi:unnamed protein product [Calypogeia fissa]
MAYFRRSTLVVLLIWVLCQRPQELLVQAQNTTTGIIDLGSTLTTDQNSTWMSQNGTFALGFHPVGLHTYTLSIWYAAIAIRTVVWTANRVSLVIEGATLSFGQDGNLVLMDSLQIHPVWETNTSSMNVFSAELLDSGNFVLRNSDLDVVWDSFSIPSDVLLPDQTLSAGMELVSAQTNQNAAMGRYSLKQDLDGYLRLYYMPSLTPYWTAIADGQESGVYSSYPDKHSLSYLNTSGFFAMYNSSGSTMASWMTTDVGSGPLRHVKLGVGGDLRIYSWSENPISWQVVWKALSDECSAINLCGPYGLCSYEPDPMCSCPEKFALVDPNDFSQGCEPPVPLNCSTGSLGQQFMKLDNFQYHGSGDSDYITLQAVSETECMKRCSEDCACQGIFYFYNGNGTCSLKSEQQSGHVDPTGNSYIKVNALVNLSIADPMEGISSHSLNSQKSLVRPEVVAAVVCAFSLACFLLSACCYYWWKEARLRNQGLGQLWNSVDFMPGAPTRFSFKDLQAATLNFSLKIGAGAFGTVHKGVLPDGTSVAVKELDDYGSNNLRPAEKQFRSEVAIIANAHHQNLVRLYGFCCEGSSHRLLVYEFIANGSLEKFIFYEPRSEPNMKLAQLMVSLDKGSSCSTATSTRASCLDWKRRFKVILGTAKAIAYLHEQCGECIVHCNINTQNILLDDQFEAKLSDVGLVKLMTTQNFKVKESHSKAKHSNCTPRSGSSSSGSSITQNNYLAPECENLASRCSGGIVHTTKSDVYSFGVVVLEVVTGKRRDDSTVDSDSKNSSLRGLARNATLSKQQQVFSEYGLQRAFRQADISELVDKNLGRKFNSVDAERALRVAAWCVQDEPASRPCMGKVVHMLEGLMSVPSLSAPKPVQTGMDHTSSGRTASENGVSPLGVPGSIGDGILEFDLNSPLISKME